MSIPLSDLRMPDPQRVFTGDGVRLATYTWGEVDAPTVVVLHGFASSTHDSWVLTGWERALVAAGFRVLGIDFRGHGDSEKPHQVDAYSVKTLANDVEQVLDTYLIDDALLLGYSLGGQVAWRVAAEIPHRVDRIVLGGVPEGAPFAAIDFAQVETHVREGTAVSDAATQQYVAITERVPGNDASALLAMARGIHETGLTSDTLALPDLPVLIASGENDPDLAASRELADGSGNAELFVIPRRHHFNAPASREFREAAVEFFRAGQ
ncbi:alpha/beta fold hydrolase [Microbacterium sp. YY-01]|uniref:alpha/beta fold hydrolase n=1 Tax=Microbacterium sp. YY-01 TaxID=3421634 RepID=UPI003D16FD27